MAAAVLASLVWLYAGFTVASGTLAKRAITPDAPGAAATSAQVIVLK